ncbi:MAG: DNA polymerase III subunit delta [Elusimicrobiota bacterium]
MGVAGKLKKEISSGKIRPAYLLTGENNYTKDEIIKLLLDQLNNKYGSCDHIKMDGKDITVGILQEEILTDTLFGKCKFIVVSNGGRLFSSPEFTDLVREKLQKKSLAQAQNVLVIKTQKKPGKIKKSLTTEVKTPYENNLPGWIKKKFRSHGKSITEEGANLLLFLCGQNLYNLNNEIEKIATAFPEKQKIFIEEVKKIAGTHKKEDIFGYLDALEKKEEKLALSLLENLLEYNTDPIRIVGMLRWKIEKLIIGRQLMREGLSEKKIIKKMGLNYYFNRGLCSKLKKFTVKELLNSYDMLQKTDVKIKNSSTDNAILLELFSIKFMNC